MDVPGEELPSKRAKGPGPEPELELSMVPEQRAAYDAYLRGENVFVTGTAGTGKSYVISEIVKHIEATHPRGALLLTGWYGLAAVALGGETFHSTFGINVGNDAYRYEKPSFNLTNVLSVARILVIDEIGVADPALLDHVDAMVRAHRNTPDRAFGGMQLLFFGDYLQLEPVVGHELPSIHQRVPAELLTRGAPITARGLGKYAFQSKLWADANFSVHNLTYVHRQSDAAFIRALDDVRHGRELSADIVAQINRPLKIQGGIVPTILYCTNRKTNEENAARLAELTTRPQTFLARDWWQRGDASNPTEGVEDTEGVEEPDAKTATSGSGHGVDYFRRGAINEASLRRCLAAAESATLTFSREKHFFLAPGHAPRELDALLTERLDKVVHAVIVDPGGERREWRTIALSCLPLFRRQLENAAELHIELLPKLVQKQYVLPEDAGALAEDMRAGKYEALRVQRRRTINLKTQFEQLTSEEKAVCQKIRRDLDRCSPVELQLKVGAQVMLTRNMREHKLANGSRGVVVAFSEPHGVVVKFLDGQRVVIEESDKNINNQRGVCGIFVRNHIPLRLAWALTIHKVQGMSIDYVIVDIAGAFANGQVYVALSRARTLEGLELRHYRAGYIRADPLALDFHRAIEEGAPAVTWDRWWEPLTVSPTWMQIFRRSYRFARWVDEWAVAHWTSTPNAEGKTLLDECIDKRVDDGFVTLLRRMGARRSDELFLE